MGQEGLDFHPYCQAVVHWNLPSNPVDLEQREGRVHRFKGHAVRKNLAQMFRAEALRRNEGDPWEALFRRGVEDRKKDENDLVPFWLYSVDPGARIERHVPTLPLTRDLDRLVELRRMLAAYRMVFGQARQDDLVAYLLQRIPAERLRESAETLRIDLRPG